MLGLDTFLRSADFLGFSGGGTSFDSSAIPGFDTFLISADLLATGGFGLISGSASFADGCSITDCSAMTFPVGTGARHFALGGVGSGRLISKGFGPSMSAFGSIGTVSSTATTSGFGPEVTDIALLAAGFGTCDRSGKTAFGLTIGSEDDTAGKEGPAEILVGGLVVALLLSVVEEPLFGVLLFGPLALAFVM